MDQIGKDVANILADVLRGGKTVPETYTLQQETAELVEDME